MFVQAQAVVLALWALDLPIWNYAAPPATVTLVQIYRRWLTARKAGVCTKSHADCDLPRFLRRTAYAFDFFFAAHRAFINTDSFFLAAALIG